MGVDIHMHILKEENGKLKFIYKEIFEGRNSEWFGNLCGEGWDDSYDSLFSYCGFPKNLSNKNKIKYNKLKEDGYYGFRYINVGDFREWYITAKPFLKAGWGTTYDKWAYEEKGIMPNDLPRYKNSEDTDAVFMSYIDKYEPSTWLYDWLTDHKISNKDIIFFYFDC